MRDTERGTEDYDTDSSSAWQYRSIPYEGEDRDKSAAIRLLEARAISSKGVAYTGTDSAYGRDADSKTSSSSIRGDNTQNKQIPKIEEERTQLLRGSSFREEKAMVSGAYDAAARGAAETGSGSALWPYTACPSGDVSAASKEAAGMGMGMRKNSSNQAALGPQVPHEQKVRAISAIQYIIAYGLVLHSLEEAAQIVNALLCFVMPCPASPSLVPWL